MTAIRRDIVKVKAARDAFIQGVLALKEERLGPTTRDVGIAGPARPLSTFDLFIVWHQIAMSRMTPPTQGDRNAAHGGPSFLPWHRLMLALLELHMQRVLGDDEVGLPYWDWAADGDLAPAEQLQAPLWQTTGIGGNGNGSAVSDGPFGADRFTVEIEAGPTARLRTTERGLVRRLGADVQTLPTSGQVATVLQRSTYDAAPWDRSVSQFRNQLEGWRPNPGPQLHNRVHVWIGGDMAIATSPNDPVFYLNHCNVDRIWEAWMTRRGRSYQPGPTIGAELTGHRLSDPLHNILVNQTITPAQVLDLRHLYRYDRLPSTSA